jgi:hypothetical protein
MPATSDPPSGSESANAAISAPAPTFGRYCSFCSLLPKSAI